MAKASNRATIIGKVHSVLKKHYEPVTPTTRSVMENLLFACCLEDGKYEQADECFSRLQESYFDWNEVRVTTVRELGEIFKGIPNASANALNLKNSLQSVFESQYAFDLEHLKRQNLGKAVELLHSYKGTTQFTVAYVTQMNLGGHSIPLGQGGVELFYIVGAIDEKETAAGTVPGLERAIPKAKGVEFGSLLHQFAADLIAAPFSQKVKSILLEIAPDCKGRMPKRVDKKKLEAERQRQEEEAQKAEEEEKKEAAKKAAAVKKAAKKAEAEKVAAREAAKKAAKAVAQKAAQKKAAKASSPAKTTAGKKKGTTATSPKTDAKKKATSKKVAKKATKTTTKKTAKAAKAKIVKKAKKPSKKSTTKSLARKKPR